MLSTAISSTISDVILLDVSSSRVGDTQPENMTVLPEQSPIPSTLVITTNPVDTTTILSLSSFIIPLYPIDINTVIVDLPDCLSLFTTPPDATQGIPTLYHDAYRDDMLENMTVVPEQPSISPTLTSTANNTTYSVDNQAEQDLSLIHI